jgi:hypothetical protein
MYTVLITQTMSVQQKNTVTCRPSLDDRYTNIRHPPVCLNVIFQWYSGTSLSGLFVVFLRPYTNTELVSYKGHTIGCQDCMLQIWCTVITRLKLNCYNAVCSGSIPLYNNEQPLISWCNGTAQWGQGLHSRSPSAVQGPISTVDNANLIT